MSYEISTNGPEQDLPPTRGGGGTPQEPKAITMTIVIVGALRSGAAIGPQLSALMGQIQAALFATFPDFLPANPAVTIVTADVRDDWIKRP